MSVPPAGAGWGWTVASLYAPAPALAMAGAWHRPVVISCGGLHPAAGEETGGVDDLLGLIERGLSFRYDGGAETTVEHPHCTGWRGLPFLVTAQGCGCTTEGGIDGGVRPRGRGRGALLGAPRGRAPPTPP